MVSEIEFPHIKQLLDSFPEKNTSQWGGKRPGAGRKPTRLYKRMAENLNMDEISFENWLAIGKLMAEDKKVAFFVNDKIIGHYLKK